MSAHEDQRPLWAILLDPECEVKIADNPGYRRDRESVLSERLKRKRREVRKAAELKGFYLRRRR